MSGGNVRVSAETVRVALEAVKMVYQNNVAWLQIHGREQEYTAAMDELVRADVAIQEGRTE